jgi:hypothetical protein
MTAMMSLPIGCLADDLEKEIAEMEIILRGEEALRRSEEEKERLKSEKLRPIAFEI